MKRIFSKVSNIQILRHISLTLVLGFFVFIPMSNWYANFKISYNNDRLVGLSDGSFNSVAYKVLDLFYSNFDNPVEAATSNNGSLWAYTIFGVPISDPLGLISEIITAVKFPMKYFLGGLIPYVLALLFGRFFCSWICPMVVINSITKRIRQVLLYLKFPLLDIKIPQNARIVVFFGGLILSYVYGMWTWHFILPYISFTHEIFSLMIFQSITVGAYFLLAIVLFEVAVTPGQYCKSVCPTGFLLSVLGKFSFFRLHSDSKSCPQGCHDCYDACPVDVYPKTNNMSSCHLCSKCVDVCPINNIEFTNLLKIAKQSEDNK